MGSKTDAALALAAKGFSVFPIRPGEKFPPMVNEWPDKATTDPEKVNEFWLVHPNANPGVHCAGRIVLDVDIAKGGFDSYAKLDMLYEFPHTLGAVTPSGGRHWIYRLPEGHPGVLNTVQSLGPGLDIRSTHGYVVGVGSETKDGKYEWVDESVPVADAPAWLIKKCGVFMEREREPKVNVPDAPEEIVEAARTWLTTAERSEKGNGGDQAAYRVACVLRDIGVSYAQACELMRSEAWNHGCGWRDGWLEAKPIRSAYSYAQNDPGTKAAAIEEFEVLQTLGESEDVPGKCNKPRSMRERRRNRRKGAGYVVKHLLDKRSYAEIFGASGEGKTFVALDIAYHVAAGKDWMGHRVRGGPVLYLAYEGVGGVDQRLDALYQKYGTDDVPLYVEDTSINIRERKGRQALGELIAEIGVKPVLIVFDTLAHALMGGDENSAQDTSAFNQAVAALMKSTDACVLIIHHSGKDKSKGARGSSALRAALETEIEIDGGLIISRKQREGKVGESIGFSLKPIVVGFDEDGDEQTSCVIEKNEAAATPLSKIQGKVKSGFKVLCDMRPDNSPVDPTDWKAACVKEFLGTSNASQRFFEIKSALIAKGYVEVNAMGDITRRMV